jgi:hypothetical protein
MAKVDPGKLDQLLKDAGRKVSDRAKRAIRKANEAAETPSVPGHGAAPSEPIDFGKL